MRLPFAFILMLLAAPAVGGDPCVELEVDGTKHRGRVFAKDAAHCWLMGNEGAITQIRLDEVTAFRRAPTDFRAVSPAVLGDTFARKFGRDYEVTKTRDHVIVAPWGRARDYADLLDKTYRTFQLYFRVRKFDVPEPEFPLVAIVYATRAEFETHCREIDVDPVGFSGFYLGRTNEIVTYEIDRPTAARAPVLDASGSRVALRNSNDGRDTAAGGIGARTEAILIHEATHQLGYNCGLHARLGWNPKWTIEGLATLFEAPGIRNRSTSRSREDRVNPGRLRDFREYAASRRKPVAIAELIESDRRLQTAVSDFYAESWALTFFLVETRPREYAGYMQGIAARDPFQRYTPAERLADFQAAFGERLDMLDAEFVRFMSKLD